MSGKPDAGLKAEALRTFNAKALNGLMRFMEANQGMESNNQELVRMIVVLLANQVGIRVAATLGQVLSDPTAEGFTMNEVEAMLDDVRKRLQEHTQTKGSQIAHENLPYVEEILDGCEVMLKRAYNEALQEQSRSKAGGRGGG